MYKNHKINTEYITPQKIFTAQSIWKQKKYETALFELLLMALLEFIMA